MDFRKAKTLQQDLLKDRCQQRVKGYDHAYLLHSTCHHAQHPAAILTSADAKLEMQVLPMPQPFSSTAVTFWPERPIVAEHNMPLMPVWR